MAQLLTCPLIRSQDCSSVASTIIVAWTEKVRTFSTLVAHVVGPSAAAMRARRWPTTHRARSDHSVVLVLVVRNAQGTLVPDGNVTFEPHARYVLTDQCATTASTMLKIPLFLSSEPRDPPLLAVLKVSVLSYSVCQGTHKGALTPEVSVGNPKYHSNTRAEIRIIEVCLSIMDSEALVWPSSEPFNASTRFGAT